MKKYLSLIVLCAIAPFANAEKSEELKFLGRTVIYEDGSWVNPDEPKFKVKEPKTWFKRNYIRHYMQGSQELTSSIIHFNWTKFKKAAKTGEKVKLGEVLTVLKLKDTYKAVKTHPEAALVPVGMLAGSVAEGSEGTIMTTVGLLKTTGDITLKTLKFISSPVRKIIPLRVEAKR